MNGDSLILEKTLPSPKFDFPGFLPPMLVKELRQGLRTRGFVGSVIILQLVLMIGFIWALAVSVGGRRAEFQAINTLYWFTAGILALGVAPLRAMFGVRQEFEARTLDLLLLTRLTAWRIVWGKWISIMTQTVLILSTLLPYGVVRYFFGKIDLVQDAETGFFLLLFGGLLTALGLWLGGMPRFFRFLFLAIAALPVWSGIAGLMTSLRYGGMAFGGVGIISGSEWAWGIAGVLFYASIAFLIIMVLAVRWMAPPSDNYSPLVRGLSLLAMLPPVVLGLVAGSNNSLLNLAKGLSVTVAVGVVIILAIECCVSKILMRVHVTRWNDGWRRFILPNVLPGWESAARFAALVILIYSIWLQLLFATPHLWMWWLLALLFWVTLVLPACVLSLVPRARAAGPALYFLSHLVIAFFSIVGINAASGAPAKGWLYVLDRLTHFLPMTNFWLTAGEFMRSDARTVPSTGVLVSQIVFCLVAIAFVIWRTRPYWNQVRYYRQQDSKPATEV